MPRGRRNAAKSATSPSNGRRRGTSSTALLREIVERTVAALVDAIDKYTRGNVADEVRAFIAAKGGAIGKIGRRGRPPGAKNRLLPCIAPGCGNPSKGPRFHYLCEKHMNAPKKDYEAWRLRAKEKAA